MNVIEDDDPAQGRRQIGDGGEDGANLLMSLEPLIGRGRLRRHRFGRAERHNLELLSSPHPVRPMTHDGAEPAGECGRLGQGGQREPCGDEGFLNDILCVPEVADERQRVAESHVLKALRNCSERVDVTARRPPYRALF